MKIADIKVGSSYRIKMWTIRPDRWNHAGMMDRYMGKTVLITGKSQSSVYIKQAPHDNYRWSFLAKNFEPVFELPEELFVI